MKLVWSCKEHSALISQFNNAKRNTSKIVKPMMPYGWSYRIQSVAFYNPDRLEYDLHWSISVNFDASPDDHFACGTWITLKWDTCSDRYKGINDFHMLMRGNVGVCTKEFQWCSPLDEKLKLALEDIPKVVNAVSEIVRGLNPDPINQLLISHEKMSAKNKKTKATATA